jgi:hydroxymethylglutaryl-CoA lyase
MTALPLAVDIREVGPRDGLQAEEPASVADRVRLIDALVGAGVRHIEAVSFVSPKAVPAMADAADVMAQVQRPSGVRWAALVPNVRGAELALGSDVDEITVTISASPAYNEKNVRMSVDESLQAIAGICALAGSVPVDGVVSCAFGSPYEGELAVADVVGLGERVVEAGATSLTYADTTGMGTPRRVAELVSAAGVDIGFHFHDTRGTALVNAFAALEEGVTRFDASVGGLGGSPFAAGAAGNLATEDFVAMLDDLGVATSIDLEAYLTASAVAAEVVAHELPSRVARAGPRSRLAG